MSQGSAGEETRRRLLEAAAEVFAKQGYRHARVRDICTRAKANVAAVNYHFRDKEQLYLSVIDYVIAKAKPRFPELERDTDPPDVRLRSFIGSFLTSIFESGRPAWYGKLVANEMTDPTPALDIVVEKLAVPLSRTLEKIVRDILGTGVDQESVKLCTLSILSQCSIYHNTREIIARMNPRRKFDKKGVNRLADHICKFSLAGMRALVPKQEGAPKRVVAGGAHKLAGERP